MQKIRHVVSPRASIFGAKLLAKGISRDIVEQTILWKGIDEVTKEKIITNISPKPVKATKTGYFTPSLEAKAIVTIGDVIGEIEYKYNSWDNRTLKVCAEADGKVENIIEEAEVNEGDILAVITV